jgi:hypothetical protein
MEISPSHFSAAEIADLRGLDLAALSQAFLLHWTLK